MIKRFNAVKEDMTRLHIDSLGIGKLKRLEMDIFSQKIMLFSTQDTPKTKKGVTLFS